MNARFAAMGVITYLMQSFRRLEEMVNREKRADVRRRIWQKMRIFTQPITIYFS
jgi:hypothetical protein